MNDITFYSILAAIVRAYPASTYNNAGFANNSQPNTFAVLTNYSSLNAENYGKTERHTNKPFYFNRNPNAGVKTTYPSVVLINQESKTDLSNGISLTSFSMLIEDAAPIIHNSLSGSVGQGKNLRTNEEVYSDLQEMGNAILREAYNKFILAEVTLTPAPNPPAPAQFITWASEDYLIAQQAANALTYEYTGKNFKDIFEGKIDSSIRLQNSDNTANNTLGYVFNFSVNLDNCTAALGFDYNKFDKNLSALPKICC